MSKRATIYLRERTISALGAIPDDSGLSQRIAAVLMRHEAMCRSLMPSFTKAEWRAIMDANNGGSDSLTVESETMPLMVWANVHDTSGLGKKWKIDQAKLVKKLQKLSRAELLAVDEAINRFWNHLDLDTDAALEAAWCNVEGK